MPSSPLHTAPSQTIISGGGIPAKIRVTPPPLPDRLFKLDTNSATKRCRHGTTRFGAALDEICHPFRLIGAYTVLLGRYRTREIGPVGGGCTYYHA